MFSSYAKANNITLFDRARSTAWQRVVVALVAVPAILVGLLAMHVLAASGEITGQHNAMATTSVMAPTIMTTPPVVSVAGCPPFCTPHHDMAAMACILALLLTALAVLALAAFGGWRAVPGALAVISALLAHASGLSPPRPPSLEFLSISRI